MTELPHSPGSSGVRSMDDDPASVAARREAMLVELTGRMRVIHRRRRLRRRLAAVTLPALAVSAAVILISLLMSKRPIDHSNMTRNRGGDGSRGIVPPSPTDPSPPDAPFDTDAASMRIELVKTDPTITDRWAAKLRHVEDGNDEGSMIASAALDDAALVAALRDIHRPAGLVRCGGKAWLTADVTDPIAPSQSDSGGAGSS